ncbi:MAG: hypothetical protein ABJ327_03820 [Litoreibacter sp.]
MLRSLIPATVGLSMALSWPAVAASDLIDRYYAALHMDEVFEVLHNEGVQAGESMTEEGQVSASPAWTARLESIYQIEKMDILFRDTLKNFGDLSGSEEAIEFFESELGERIARLELDARVALADTALEDETREHVAIMRDVRDPRVALYEQFVEVNELIDSNVSGALNANLAFYRGLASNPAFEGGLTEEFMLTTVWEQEEQIREDMADWTMNFSTLAYSSLTEEEVQEYINISATPAGQKLNTALFAGFDDVFELHSFELGRATAEFSVGDDI